MIFFNVYNKHEKQKDLYFDIVGAIKTLDDNEPCDQYSM
jgi:hypothetical protein